MLEGVGGGEGERVLGDGTAVQRLDGAEVLDHLRKREMVMGV